MFKNLSCKEAGCSAFFLFLPFIRKAPTADVFLHVCCRGFCFSVKIEMREHYYLKCYYVQQRKYPDVL